MTNEVFITLRMVTEIYSGQEGKIEQEERGRSLKRGIEMYQAKAAVSYNTAKAIIEEQMNIYEQKEISDLREMFLSESSE